MNFNKALLFAAEANVSACPKDPFNGILSIDPNTLFLSSVMNYTSDAIQQDLNNAIVFFRDRFGIDFTGAPMMNGGWKQDNAWLTPFISSTNLNYSQLYPQSAQVRFGGWMVQVEEPGFVGQASFNGQNSVAEYPTCGKVLYPGKTTLFFGYFKVVTNSCQKVYHVRSTRPHVSTNTHPYPDELDVWDPDLNVWGKADSVSTVSSNGDGTDHISIRTVLTVPGRL